VGAVSASQALWIGARGGTGMAHRLGAAGGGGKIKDTSLATFYVHKDAVTSMHLRDDVLFASSFDGTVSCIDLHHGVAVQPSRPCGAPCRSQPRPPCRI